MTILCVVAHPDDEVLGVGGTLARHAAADDDVHVSILADGVGSRHDEITPAVEERIESRRRRAREACRHLGVERVNFHDFPDNSFDTVPLLDVVKSIERDIAESAPEVVYTHHHGDLNVDHELTCRAVVTATRPLAGTTVRRVLAAETLSATEWGVPSPARAFQPSTFVDISDHLNDKLTALKSYEGELREPPHPRTVETVRKNAEVWGAKSGFAAAEPFEVLRERVPYSETNSFR